MRPRPKPLQASVHLPHRPHRTQVSVGGCARKTSPRAGLQFIVSTVRP